MSDKLNKMKNAFAGAKRRYNEFNGIIAIPEAVYMTEITEISQIPKQETMYKIVRTITEGEYAGDKVEQLLMLENETNVSFFLQWLKAYGVEDMDAIDSPEVLISVIGELASSIEEGKKIREEIDFSIFTSAKNGKKYPNVKTLSFIQGDSQPIEKEVVKEEVKKEVKKAKKPSLKKKSTKANDSDLSGVIEKLASIDGLEVTAGMSKDAFLEAIDPFIPFSADELSEILDDTDVNILKEAGVQFE